MKISIIIFIKNKFNKNKVLCKNRLTNFIIHWWKKIRKDDQIPQSIYINDKRNLDVIIRHNQILVYIKFYQLS